MMTCKCVRFVVKHVWPQAAGVLLLIVTQEKMAPSLFLLFLVAFATVKKTNPAGSAHLKSRAGN